MKKLMFVAAAALAGSVFAAGEITSKNVVGYQSVGVEEKGFKFSAPTFNAIGGSFDIQDIKLVFDTEVTGGDNLQLLGTGGETLETYYWYPADWMYPVPENDGWQDSNTGALAEKEIKAGQGFLIDIIDTSTVIQYAGEVGTTNTVVADVAKGFNFTGNNVPRDVDIQEIQLEFTTEVTGGDNLQLLGTGGETLETYYWYPKDWMYPVPANDGWQDSNTGALAEKEIKAGEGFLVDVIDASTKIVLPKAINK